MRSVAFAVLFVAAAALAACGGGASNVYPYPSIAITPTPQSGTVAFTFLVPTPAPALRTRNITLPSSAQSVKITLDSIGGSPAPSSSPTTANLTGSTAGCSGTNALTCNVNVSAPVGTLVYTVTVYGQTNAGGAPVSEGNLSVTTTAGTTTSAPATLNGTVAKIAITLGGVAELGAVVNVPVVVQAEDSNGYTILGTYNSPITLSDSDASGQTSLSATNVPDSTTAAGIMLDYLGGAMSGAATINATASGVSASNITPGSFAPDETYPTVASSAQLEYTYGYSYWENGANPSPTQGPNGPYGPYSHTWAIATAVPTSSPFAGLNNVITIQGETNAYYTWTPSGSSLDFTYLGYSDNSSDTVNYTYCSPAELYFEIPLPASWSVYPTGGVCTNVYDYNTQASDPTNYQVEASTNNADGSYTLNYTYNFGAPGNGGFSVDSSGDVTATVSDPNTDYSDGSFYLSAQQPTSNAATVTASYLSYVAPSPLPSPLPSPTVTTAPNPWQYMAASLNGMPPHPLQSDVYNNEGTIAASALPAACAVPSSVMPSTSSLTHLQEVWHDSDPMDWNTDNYEYGTNDWYYLAGVGIVCVQYAYTYYDFDGYPIDWYDGNDQNIDGGNGYETYYVTASTLTAQLAHARSMSEATSKASLAFVAAVRQQHATLRKQRLQAHRAKVAKMHASKR